MQYTAYIVFSQSLQRVCLAGHRQAQDAALVGVVHQRVEAGFAITGPYGHQRDFAGKGYKAFQQAGHAAQLGEGINHVFRRAQHLLALPS